MFDLGCKFFMRVGHHLANGGLCLIFCPHRDFELAMARRIETRGENNVRPE